MLNLFVHDDAKADLESLWVKAPRAAARITVLLEELQADHDLLDRLTQHDFGRDGSADFHISKWYEQWNKGKDLWRLKVWELQRHRIVYAFIPQKEHYHILAIAPRAFDYKSNHPLTKRILAAYETIREGY